MKRKTMLVTILTVAMIAAVAGFAQARGGMMGYGGGMMGYGWGGDRDGNRGGYECDGPRYGGGGYGCDGPGSYNRPRGGAQWGEDGAKIDITREEAEVMVSFRLRRTNPNLKVGKITENEEGFQVEVVTKKGGDLVDRLQVEKDTGRVYRIFE